MGAEGMTDHLTELRDGLLNVRTIRTLGGAGGQTIEATMRAQIVNLTRWDAEEAADALTALIEAREASRNHMVAAATVIDEDDPEPNQWFRYSETLRELKIALARIDALGKETQDE